MKKCNTNCSTNKISLSKNKKKLFFSRQLKTTSYNNIGITNINDTAYKKRGQKEIIVREDNSWKLESPVFYSYSIGDPYLRLTSSVLKFENSYIYNMYVWIDLCIKKHEVSNFCSSDLGCARRIWTWKIK